MSVMGTGEMGTPSKTTKTSTSQDQPPPTTVAMSYPPEWAAAFQAYYSSGMTPMPPPGYFPSTVSSGPQPHPYMWGAQPLMPPYGTPPPFASMYPHGGIYAHPSMPAGSHPFSPYSLATGNTSQFQEALASAGPDAEGKSSDGKAKSHVKRSKGSLRSLGMLIGKGEDARKWVPGSMNGFVSNSGDGGSEGSTEGSEECSQNGVADQVMSEEAPNHAVNSTLDGDAHDVNHVAGNHLVPAMPISTGGNQVPHSNMNIGSDYWIEGKRGVLAAGGRGKRGSSAAVTTAMVPSTNMLGPARDGVSGELWLQDERELKRQRRKQSNRESARRSRLRKQAECEELAVRVETLTKENESLRFRLDEAIEECKKLSAENCSLLDRLQLPRPEGMSGEMEKHMLNISTSEVLQE